MRLFIGQYDGIGQRIVKTIVCTDVQPVFTYFCHEVAIDGWNCVMKVIDGWNCVMKVIDGWNCVMKVIDG